MKLKTWTLSSGGLGACALLLWWGTSVNDTLTRPDKMAIRSLELRCSPIDGDAVRRVKMLQACVLAQIPQGVIPLGESREPGDIVKAGHGECHDRARLMEKTLRSWGFRTRHAFVLTHGSFGWLGWFRKGIPSHAVFDVLTVKGWMSVGTNELFLGVTKTGDVVATSELKLHADSSYIVGSPAQILRSGYVVYGLWSRHGYFMKPYLPLPDISWHEFMENF